MADEASVADEASGALAKRLNLPVVTADAAWVDLADELGVEVVVVR